MHILNYNRITYWMGFETGVQNILNKMFTKVEAKYNAAVKKNPDEVLIGMAKGL